MNTERDIALNALKALPADTFIAQRLFDCVPHVFAGDREMYLSWKTALAKSLEVDPACIQFVGSGAIGISLNPSKGFKPFDGDSDIDVGVISPYHFTTAWRYLRANGHRRYRVDARTRSSWDEHVNRYIYWGTIATDRLLGILPFGKVWLAALSEMARMAPTTGRDIKLRVYSDYESLRAYQISSARRAKDDLISSGGTYASIS